MIVIDMLTWWYTTAWIKVLHDIQRHTTGVLEAFSVGLLVRTFFSPFRQIDAGGVRGPINIQLRAWLDRTFSRFFGAIVRSVMIFSGCLFSIVVFVAGVIWAAFWLIIPVLPIIGVIMMAAG